MKIATKYCGDVEIDPLAVIAFPSGIPGFEQEKEFVLLDLPSASSVLFQTLQSVTEPSLAFIVLNPYMLTTDYEFKLDDTTIEGLHIKNKEEIGVFAIVSVDDPFESSVLNLKAPIIINHTERIGKQFIIPLDTYDKKTPLLSLINKGVKEGS